MPTFVSRTLWHRSTTTAIAFALVATTFVEGKCIHGAAQHQVGSRGPSLSGQATRVEEEHHQHKDAATAGTFHEARRSIMHAEALAFDVDFKELTVVIDTSAFTNLCVQGTSTTSIPNYLGYFATCSKLKPITEADTQYAVLLVNKAVARLKSTFYVRLYPTLTSPTVGTSSSCYTGTAATRGPSLPSSWANSDAKSHLYLAVGLRPMGDSYEEGVTAWSAVCQVDSATSRPIVAYLNLVPENMDSALAAASPARFQADLDAVTHELLHLFGFRHYYLPSGYGTATTSRPGPFTSTKGYLSRNNANFSLKTDGWISQTTFTLGKSRLLITSPRAVDAARAYLGCSTLTGVEAEDTTPGDLHLEARVYADDLMTATPLTRRRYISNITISVIEDTGYYMRKFNIVAEGDQDNAQTFGRNGGCEHADQKCDSAVNRVSGFYCLDDAADAVFDRCGEDRRTRLHCSRGIRSGSTISRSDQRYTYTTTSVDARHDGGRDIADFCPMLEPYSDGSCGVEPVAVRFGNGSLVQRAWDGGVLGELYSSASRCFVSDVLMVGYSDVGVRTRCLKTACDAYAGQTDYVITLTDGSTVKCPLAGGNVSVVTRSYFGTIVCPAFSTVCGTRANSVPADYIQPSSSEFPYSSTIGTRDAEHNFTIMPGFPDAIAMNLTAPTPAASFAQGSTVACADRFEACFVPWLDRFWGLNDCNSVALAFARCYLPECQDTMTAIAKMASKQMASGRTVVLFASNCTAGSSYDALRAKCNSASDAQMADYCEVTRLALLTRASSAAAMHVLVLIGASAAAVLLMW